VKAKKVLSGLADKTNNEARAKALSGGQRKVYARNKVYLHYVEFVLIESLEKLDRESLEVTYELEPEGERHANGAATAVLLDDYPAVRLGVLATGKYNICDPFREVLFAPKSWKGPFKVKQPLRLSRRNARGPVRAKAFSPCKKKKPGRPEQVFTSTLQGGSGICLLLLWFCYGLLILTSRFLALAGMRLELFARTRPPATVNGISLGFVRGPSTAVGCVYRPPSVGSGACRPCAAARLYVSV
jgi:hypothetical protein